jgi:hypothetical protein
MEGGQSVDPPPDAMEELAAAAHADERCSVVELVLAMSAALGLDEALAEAGQGYAGYGRPEGEALDLVLAAMQV